MNRLNKRRGVKCNGDESLDWTEFSSDSSDDDSSVGDPTKAEGRKNAPKKKTKVATKASKIPRKAGRIYGTSGKSGKSRKRPLPRKVIDKVFGNKKKAVAEGKFGAGAGHQNKGCVHSKSPAGRPMVLSRRLSRKITRGSPLGSPIVACQLDFSLSALKPKKSRATKNRTSENGRPPRAP
mmetsp:Transcript_29256/g.60980  ORF Transcript_29256/g.60980 Transcript_29256/m.60980 type:complete len:180 (+) Transcript_29256:183-722(+)